MATLVLDFRVGRASMTARTPPDRQRKPYTKTRAGCQTCKRRRVKCSLERPRCRACARLGHPCQYPPPTGGDAALAGIQAGSSEAGVAGGAQARARSSRRAILPAPSRQCLLHWTEDDTSRAVIVDAFCEVDPVGMGNSTLFSRVIAHESPQNDSLLRLCLTMGDLYRCSGSIHGTTMSSRGFLHPPRDSPSARSYAQSVAGLRGSLATASPRAMLLGSKVLVCLEMMQGNTAGMNAVIARSLALLAGSAFATGVFHTAGRYGAVALYDDAAVREAQSVMVRLGALGVVQSGKLPEGGSGCCGPVADRFEPQLCKLPGRDDPPSRFRALWTVFFNNMETWKLSLCWRLTLGNEVDLEALLAEQALIASQLRQWLAAFQAKLAATKPSSNKGRDLHAALRLLVTYINFSLICLVPRGDKDDDDDDDNAVTTALSEHLDRGCTADAALCFARHRSPHADGFPINSWAELFFDNALLAALNLMACSGGEAAEELSAVQVASFRRLMDAMAVAADEVESVRDSGFLPIRVRRNCTLSMGTLFLEQMEGTLRGL